MKIIDWTKPISANSGFMGNISQFIGTLLREKSQFTFRKHSLAAITYNKYTFWLKINGNVYFSSAKAHKNDCNSWRQPVWRIIFWTIMSSLLNIPLQNHIQRQFGMENRKVKQKTDRQIDAYIQSAFSGFIPSFYFYFLAQTYHIHLI